MPATHELYANPSAHFASPDEVLLSTTLDGSEKLQVLEAWMATTPENQKLQRLIERAKENLNGGSDDAPNKTPPANRSWDAGNRGQGGEGLSKGYGGSDGSGVGPAGPEDK